jgi:hypothetical protein
MEDFFDVARHKAMNPNSQSGRNGEKPIWFFVSVGAALAVLVWFLVARRSEGPAPPPRAQSTASEAPREEGSARAAPPESSEAPPPKASALAPLDEATTDAIPADPEAAFPLPSPDQISPRPERPDPTPEEGEEARAASLELIERSITRLEEERKRAELAGDAATARRNQIRIDRLRKRREALLNEKGER